MSTSEAQKQQRRKRFFDAISTTPSTREPPQTTAQSSAQPHPSERQKPHPSTGRPFELKMKLSDRISQKYHKAMRELPSEMRGTIEATEQLVALVRAELSANPSELWIDDDINASFDDFLGQFKVFVAIEQTTWQPEDAVEPGQTPRPPRLSFEQLVQAVRASLPPALQQAQDILFGVEEARAKTGMPLDPDPLVNRSFINNVLQDNGEKPFPFQQFTEQKYGNSRRPGMVSIDMPAQMYLLDLIQRKPTLHKRLVDMIGVYAARAQILGGHIKTSF